jgi:small-conductance mechanosensitive channel
MRTRFLLPRKFKPFGWILLAIAILLYLWINVFGDIPLLANAKILCIYYSGFPLEKNPATSMFFQVHQTNLAPDIIGILIIVGCLFVAFSRLKIEDEYISKIRLESLVWATCVNFILLIIAIMTIWGLDFLVVMEYNMVTILILFVLRFHYVLFQSRKIKGNEK